MALERDTVELLLGDRVFRIVENYQVKVSVIEQPARFSFQLGRGDQFKELVELVRGGPDFELRINGATFQTGEIEAWNHSGSVRSLPIRGACFLKELVRGRVEDGRQFSETTYAGLTNEALIAVGLEDLQLLAFNEANRKAITGTDVIRTLIENPNADSEEELIQISEKRVYRTLKAQLGTTWWNLLAKEYEKEGLFLWSAGDGSLILSKPQTAQSPIYSLIRSKQDNGSKLSDLAPATLPRIKNTPGDWFGNILDHRHSDDRSNRYTECVVYTNGPGGRGGWKKIHGYESDLEMVDFLDPDRRQRARLLTVYEKEAGTKEACEKIAARKIAESRRNGWKLAYQVAGHSTRVLGERINWAHDTTVEVVDDLLGIYGTFYLDSVDVSGSIGGGQTAWLTLMRPEDMLYATGKPPMKRRPVKDFTAGSIAEGLASGLEGIGSLFR